MAKKNGEKKEEGESVESLKQQLSVLQAEHNQIAALAVNGFQIMTDVGHNLIQNGSALQEFTKNNQQLYIRLAAKLVQSQQNQAKK